MNFIDSKMHGTAIKIIVRHFYFDPCKGPVLFQYWELYFVSLFVFGATAHRGSGPPHSRGF